jgi:hypothetical protein
MYICTKLNKYSVDTYVLSIVCMYVLYRFEKESSERSCTILYVNAYTMSKVKTNENHILYNALILGKYFYCIRTKLYKSRTLERNQNMKSAQHYSRG